MQPWQFYGGAIIGFLEICSILLAFAAGFDAFFGKTDKERERGCKVGIAAGVVLIVLIQIGHPFFDGVHAEIRPASVADK